MDKDVMIRVDRLSKRYTLGRNRSAGGYTALRDVLSDQVRWLWKKRGPETDSAASDQEFWALRDVSFEVGRGEVVGIIGRNGAGKSTLLKVLSRITEPTAGRISLKGRVASLLEVGTGFHPELTGRENIFLNGAILGMHRSEIKAKFDEIVAFAEVERFLDTPVKRYSSGMYVRLAFAVAAHLEPEILIVDEVLAVGDVEFQKKCLGKMGEVARGGRTVLFVSHQMNAVQALCSRGILLNRGQVQQTGTVAEVIRVYLSSGTSNDQFMRQVIPDEDGRPKVTAATLSWDDADHDQLPRVLLALKLYSRTERRVALDVRLSDAMNNPVGFGSLGTLDEKDMLELRAGYNALTVTLPTDLLANGSYQISLDLTMPFVEHFDRVESCLQFDLDRAAELPAARRTTQQWGYGSVTLPLALAFDASPAHHAL